MFWPHWKYVEYVKKNAGPAGAQELLEPASEPVDPKFPNVLVTFRSMPDWMDWYDFTIDDDSFKLLLHRYRSQMRDYKEKLRRQFQPLTAGSVGPALLNELGGVNRVVKFRPYWNWLDPVDSDTTPMDVTHPDTEDYADAIAKGARFRRNGQRVVGTGAGANSIIGYSPELWGPGGASRIRGAGYDPDEIMFHEMVHASRQMRGVQDYTSVYPLYDNVEEYIAIVLCNIYMSEKGATTLVGGHGDEPLRQPEKFLDNVQNIDLPPRQLMLQFKGDQPNFYRDLANLGPPVPAFNPVWQFDRDLRAGKALANVMLGDSP